MLNKIEAQERLVHSPGLSQDRGQSLYDQAVNLAVCGIEHARRRFDYGSMFSRIKLRGGESLEEVPRKAFFIVFGSSEPRLGCDLIEDILQSAKLVRFESTFRSGIHHTSPPQTHPERRIAPRLAAFKISPNASNGGSDER